MADKRLYHKLNTWNLLLAALSGVLLALAFPRPGLFPLAWVGLVPLFVALRGVRPRGGFLLGFVTGTVFFAILMGWVRLFGYAPWALLSLVQGVTVGVFGLVVVLFCRRERLAILAVPAAWTLVEWLKSLGTYGLTWGGLSYSQSDWPAVVRIAGIGGPWAVTFLIVLFNMVLAGFIVDRNRPNRKVLFIVAGVCALNVVGGWVYGRAGKLPQPTKRVAIVQGGVDITWIDSEVAARMVDAYWPLMGLIDGKADLIVWPESALPGDLLANPWLKSEISRFARDNRAYLLLGGYHDADDSEAEVGYREYNGAYLVSPDGKLTSKYYKVHLVPFGEFVPGRDWLPFINSYHIQDVDRSPGTGYNTMDAAFGRLGTMICFESTFPAIGREFASRGAGALVVLTNDSWFGKTAAAAQHHQFSVLRAVETRRYVVRAATTGISSVITPDGRVIRSVGLGKSAVIYGRIAMIKGETIFVRFGDWFVYLCMVIVVFGLFSKGQNTTGRSR